MKPAGQSDATLTGRQPALLNERQYLMTTIDLTTHVADPPEYVHPDPEDYYAEVCEQPGCTHDRGSHWDATGDCGWCPCGQFRTAAVIDQDDPAQFATLANAYLPDDQPPF